ncbi:hypothetical protein [Bacillus alveayuensis]|jgi:hypothetical protein|uniref:Uncharacterized protein n=1 Tax=Aeribacillus alveayuensis TaxID=279215 RepID=A0ABT9VJV5_9BACI|nr:hypothetical protein [Bacillus alveayuensis]MDQ0161232.1 hypothetical protein [Bacillus alveayuensis]
MRYSRKHEKTGLKSCELGFLKHDWALYEEEVPYEFASEYGLTSQDLKKGKRRFK